MHRIEINVQTGEQRTVELTAAEIAEMQSQPAPESAPALTAEQKLKAAGLTIAELKELLAA